LPLNPSSNKQKKPYKLKSYITVKALKGCCFFKKKQQKPRLARVGVFLAKPMKEGEGQPGGLRRPNHAQRLGQSLSSAQKKNRAPRKGRPAPRHGLPSDLFASGHQAGR
jgi:hypothetical protein